MKTTCSLTIMKTIFALFGLNVTKESRTIFSVFDKYRNLYCYLLNYIMKRIHSSVEHNLKKKTLSFTSNREKVFVFSVKSVNAFSRQNSEFKVFLLSNILQTYMHISHYIIRIRFKTCNNHWVPSNVTSHPLKLKC